MDKSTGQEMEQAAEPMPLLEWFSEKYRDFGAKLEVREASDHSSSGGMSDFSS